MQMFVNGVNNHSFVLVVRFKAISQKKNYFIFKVDRVNSSELDCKRFHIIPNKYFTTNMNSISRFSDELLWKEYEMLTIRLFSIFRFKFD